jgi:hypothetical protein
MKTFEEFLQEHTMNPVERTHSDKFHMFAVAHRDTAVKHDKDGNHGKGDRHRDLSHASSAMAHAHAKNLVQTRHSLSMIRDHKIHKKAKDLTTAALSDRPHHLKTKADFDKHMES